MMVPITIFAFVLGLLTVKGELLYTPTVYDVIGMTLAFLGVGIYNCYKEKPQKISKEDF